MTMTRDDIYRLAQSESLTLAFDTSVTVRRGFLALCDLANRINERWRAMEIQSRLRLCVPAAAHTERLFDLAQQHGAEYNLQVIRLVLRQRQIEIPDFTVYDAEHCAELLAQRYATANSWHAFKKQRCLDCAGLPFEYHHLAAGSGQSCGAPNDWLIIAQASRGEMLLVMDDKGRGGEYDLIERTACYSQVREALQQIFDELQKQFGRVN